MADKPTSIRRVRPHCTWRAGGAGMEVRGRHALTAKVGEVGGETMHAAHSWKDASSNIELGR